MISGHRCSGSGGRAPRPGQVPDRSPALRCCASVREAAGPGRGRWGGRHRKSPRHPHPVPRPCRPPRPRAPAPAATTAAAAFAFAFATVAAGLSRPRRQLCGLNPSRPGHSPGPPPPPGGEVRVRMGTRCVRPRARRCWAQRTLQCIARCGARVRAPRLATVTEAARMEEKGASQPTPPLSSEA